MCTDGVGVPESVACLIANANGDDVRGADLFWENAEWLSYVALVGYLVRRCPEADQSLSGLVTLLSLAGAREVDFINLWAPPGERICRMSGGWIDKAGYLNLEGGPLFERQGEISQFSKNRRFAFLETPIASKPVRLMARVRITRNDHLRPWER